MKASIRFSINIVSSWCEKTCYVSIRKVFVYRKKNSFPSVRKFHLLERSFISLMDSGINYLFFLLVLPSHWKELKQKKSSETHKSASVYFSVNIIFLGFRHFETMNFEILENTFVWINRSIFLALNCVK